MPGCAADLVVQFIFFKDKYCNKNELTNHEFML